MCEVQAFANGPKISSLAISGSYLLPLLLIIVTVSPRPFHTKMMKIGLNVVVFGRVCSEELNIYATTKSFVRIYPFQRPAIKAISQTVEKVNTRTDLPHVRMMMRA